MLSYSTYLGGAGLDQATGIAVDGLGNAYVVGTTASTNFPVTTGAYDTSFNGSTDAFVAELNAAGTALVYATYLGGVGGDSGLGIAVDGSGNAFVTGSAVTSNFPTTAGSFGTTFHGASDAFVTRINSTGTGLVWSGLLGGSGGEQGNAVAVSGTSVFVAGSTTGSFPATTGAFQSAYGGGSLDGFVARIDNGTAQGYASYYGGGADNVI